MNLNFQKFAPSRELENMTRLMLAALLRYPDQLPANLRLISPQRLNFCGNNGETVNAILAQYEKAGAYNIPQIQHATKRKDLTQIAGTALESDLGFYVDVWNADYTRWAYGEALRLSESELVLTGEANAAESAFEQVKSHLHYELKAQTETDWRKEHADEVERKLNGVKLDTKTLNIMPGYSDILPEFEAATLNIIAGRPGMGKTQALLAILQGFEKQGAKGCVWTLEMPGRQMARRIMSAMAGVNHRAVWATLSEEKKQKIRECREIIINANYDFREGHNLRQILSEARQLHKQGKLDYLIIDHIGLMSTGDTYRDRDDNKRLSTLSGALKNIANELRIPVIPLSQLNRSVETRGGSKRPQLSDLRDSGALEQDADTVTFIHRPEYYGIMEDEQGQSTVGIAEFIVAKYRDGEPGTGVCGFHPVRGFVFSESEMRGGEQVKIMAMKGQREAQIPDEEPAWMQGKMEPPKQARNDDFVPF